MLIQQGVRLGPYELISLLGEGGMGQVWRARDTRLDRDVAVKLLRSDLAGHPDLRERFDREARAVSRLSHPHICTLFDVGHHEGHDFLVMELLEGETLADRLSRGPMSMPQLLRTGAEIAHALDAAHRAGLIHRDLKPGNVMLTKSGVKVLDFGLAKLASGADRSVPSSHDDPTVHLTAARPLTTEGSLLGTMQYMAPEQLEGQPVDSRTDIFALGLILYEMATGQRAFGAKSRASLIAKILEHEPPTVSSLVPLTPPRLEELIARCMRKDPEERIQNSRDVAHTLESIAKGEHGAKESRTSRSRWALPVAIAAAALFAILAVLLMIERRAPHVSRLEVELAPDEQLARSADCPVAVSPDGRRIAYCVLRNGEVTLAVRALDNRQHTLFDLRTYEPFWSPDGKSIGYFTDGAINRIDLDSGIVRRLSGTSDGRGASWSATGTILASLADDSGIRAFDESGGSPRWLLKPDIAAGEIGYWRPFWVDEDRYIFSVKRRQFSDFEVRLASVRSGLLRSIGMYPTPPRYVEGGLLLYVDGTNLIAQRVDESSLEPKGAPFPVAANIAYSRQYGSIAVSVASSTLAFQPREIASSLNIEVYDRTGARRILTSDGGDNLDLSPNGRHLAYQRIDDGSRGEEIWRVDTSNPAATPVTFDSNSQVGPVWAPDNDQIAFLEQTPRGASLAVRRLSSGAHRTLFPVEGSDEPVDWSADGAWLAVESGTPPSLFLRSLDGARTIPVAATPEVPEHSLRFSPDGRWVAYVSQESGVNEVYVKAFPPDARRWQVSAGGGEAPRWRGDSRELYFVSDRALMVVQISGDRTLLPSSPVALFPTSNIDYDAAPDGNSFYVRGSGHDASSPIRVVVGWTPPEEN